MKFFKALGCLLLGLCLQATVHAQSAGVAGAEQSSEHVKARLIPETTAAVAGSTLWVALRLEHAEHWHTYWINPGDAGKVTEVAWELPAGVSAGAIVWPTPTRFNLPGDLVDFGYVGEIFELVPIQIPADFAGGNKLSLTAKANWLECEDTCIPASATLTLDLPVLPAGQSAAANTQWAYGFARTRESQPRNDVKLDASFFFSKGELNLLVQATSAIFDGAGKIEFIPDQHRVVEYISPQDISKQQNSLQLKQKQHRRVEREQPKRVGGLLLVADASGKQTAYQIDAQPAAGAVSEASDATPSSAPVTAASNVTIAGAFLFAFLGGLILNLMPCVFPVLSLKVLHLAATTHITRREQQLHGLTYMAGVMLSFLVLAGVLLSLKATGTAAGWGFHLQQPWFVASLVFLFFVMGLSMSGVVEFGASVMGVGSDLQEKEGYAGSFFTGVLASVVASPCTAPFMGAALGFAFTQSTLVALTVFLALGFGMALPFVLLSFLPALAKMMPRPGAWMLTFRQVLAFPLYATVVWLLWVLGQQTDSNAMALVIGACLVLAFACWLYQYRHNSSGLWRHASLLLVLLCVITTGSTLFTPFLQARARSDVAADASENYEPYTAARLAALRAQGKPVFVNMTAAWCITCLVNERVALGSDAFAAGLKQKGVTYLKGDWTNNDPAITEVLKQYETSGVPLYLMFPSDSSKPAEVLPQILTQSIVLGALERI